MRHSPSYATSPLSRAHANRLCTASSGNTKTKSERDEDILSTTEAGRQAGRQAITGPYRRRSRRRKKELRDLIIEDSDSSIDRSRTRPRQRRRILSPSPKSTFVEVVVKHLPRGRRGARRADPPVKSTTHQRDRLRQLPIVVTYPPRWMCHSPLSS